MQSVARQMPAMRTVSTRERKLRNESARSPSSHEEERTMSKLARRRPRTHSRKVGVGMRATSPRAENVAWNGGGRWRNAEGEGGRRTTSRQFDAGRGAENVRRDRPANHEDLPN